MNIPAEAESIDVSCPDTEFIDRLLARLVVQNMFTLGESHLNSTDGSSYSRILRSCVCPFLPKDERWFCHQKSDKIICFVTESVEYFALRPLQENQHMINAINFRSLAAINCTQFSYLLHWLKFHTCAVREVWIIVWNMAACICTISLRLKQCAMIKILSAENVAPIGIHRENEGWLWRWMCRHQYFATFMLMVYERTCQQTTYYLWFFK